MSTALHGAADVVRGFLGWWLAELAGCLPAALRSASSASSVLLRLEGDGLLLSVRGRAKGRFALPLDGEVRGRIGKALRGRRVTVVVGADRVLSCPVDLPLAAERAPLAALRFEVDRRTPFRAADVHLGWRPAGRDPAGRRVRGEMACVPRRSIAGLTGMLEEEGCGIDALHADLGGDLVALSRPGAGAPRRWSVARLAWRAGVVAAVVAIAAGPVVALQRLDAAADEAEAALAAVRPQAARAAELQRHLDETEARARLIGTHRGEASALRVLAEVAAITADDTYLRRFRFDGATVQIDGLSRSAAAVAAAIEASAILCEPSFRSPVVPVGDGVEEFSLAAGIDLDEPRREVKP